MASQAGSKTVKLKGAVSIFGVILAIIVVGRLVLGFDVALLLMFCGMFTTLVYCFCYKYTWEELFDKGVVPMVARAVGAILILLTVGPLIAVWMLSGTIPYLIYRGLQLLNPQTFLAAAFVICALSSTFTGTSWGTAATFGVAFIGIAQGLGVSLAAAAGAVVAGSYFGDKLSPVSDTTILAAAVARVEVVDHIRSMLWTTIPAFLISVGVYAWVGSQASGEIDMSKVGLILNGIRNTFKLSPMALIPPVVILILAYRRCPTLPVLWLAIVISIPLAMTQGADIPAIFKAMASGPKITTGLETLDRLLSRGGIASMTASTVVVFFAYLFAGQLECTGTFHTICAALREKFIGDSRGRLVMSTSLTGILTGLGTGNSYLSEIVPGTMYGDLFDEMNISRRVLSRTLEDSGTVIVPLIPWSAAGIYMSSVLEVPVLDYAPWAILCYLGFLTAWIYGFTGIGIWKADPSKTSKS
ncbi:MAG: Na+/H+ antiporter NhaC [Synergistaceae bacterium]|jgi:NhaC family Na+:H+ antiporter|nr:Na+/H+ antiporter NhaC [Synergistaceae bacterium]